MWKKKKKKQFCNKSKSRAPNHLYNTVAAESNPPKKECCMYMYTVVSNTHTENGKKLRNFFIREFPIESIGKCNRAGICYNHYGNFSQ